LGDVELPDRRVSQALTRPIADLDDPSALVDDELQRGPRPRPLGKGYDQPASWGATPHLIGYAATTKPIPTILSNHEAAVDAAPARVAAEPDKSVSGQVEVVEPRPDALELEAYRQQAGGLVLAQNHRVGRGFRLRRRGDQ
jgi:hypothetical protein